MKNCYVWLYRGAWNEWKVYDIDMAVPLSPDQVLRKRRAIFKHQSQKDGAVFPGDDIREFWQRAEERNKATADLYSNLGLAKYAAIEGFKRYIFQILSTELEKNLKIIIPKAIKIIPKKAGASSI